MLLEFFPKRRSRKKREEIAKKKKGQLLSFPGKTIPRQQERGREKQNASSGGRWRSEFFLALVVVEAISTWLVGAWIRTSFTSCELAGSILDSPRADDGAGSSEIHTWGGQTARQKSHEKLRRLGSELKSTEPRSRIKRVGEYDPSEQKSHNAKPRPSAWCMPMVTRKIEKRNMGKPVLPLRNQRHLTRPIDSTSAKGRRSGRGVTAFSFSFSFPLSLSHISFAI